VAEAPQDTTGPKIAVIGAGSYVFSLGLLYDLIVAHRLAGSRLALMDVDEEKAVVTARIAGRMARDAGVELAIEPTTNRRAALRDAAFVTVSVAVEIRRRWEMDKAALHRHGIPEILSECGGVGGLSYALRSGWLVLGIARDMEALCPAAWLLNTTNPLPRVVAAVTQHTRIRTVGFCNVAWGGEDHYKNVGGLLGRDPRGLEVVSGGLNHFAWLLSVRDRQTGEDLMPAVRAAVESRSFGGSITMNCWRRYGWLPLSSDSHIGEFLPFDPAISHELIAHHGDDRERAVRRAALLEAAEGTRPWQTLLEGRAWERPGDLIHALATSTARHLDMINVPNRGAIAGLPEDAVVEIPAEVKSGELRPVRIGALPGPIAELCAPISAVHTLAADAAATGDRALLEEAIRIDPAIADKPAALRAITELIRAHADLLPKFSSVP